MGREKLWVFDRIPQRECAISRCRDRMELALGLGGGLGPELVVAAWTPNQATWTRSGAEANATLTYDGTLSDANTHIYTSLLTAPVLGAKYKFVYTISNVQSGKKACLGFKPGGLGYTGFGDQVLDAGTFTSYGVATSTVQLMRVYGYTTDNGGSFSVIVNSIRRVL